MAGCCTGAQTPEVEEEMEMSIRMLAEAAAGGEVECDGQKSCGLLLVAKKPEGWERRAGAAGQTLHRRVELPSCAPVQDQPDGRQALPPLYLSRSSWPPLPAASKLPHGQHAAQSAAGSWESVSRWLTDC